MTHDQSTTNPTEPAPTTPTAPGPNFATGGNAEILDQLVGEVSATTKQMTTSGLNPAEVAALRARLIELLTQAEQVVQSLDPATAARLDANAFMAHLAAIKADLESQ